MKAIRVWKRFLASVLCAILLLSKVESVGAGVEVTVEAEAVQEEETTTAQEKTTVAQEEIAVTEEETVAVEEETTAEAETAAEEENATAEAETAAEEENATEEEAAVEEENATAEEKTTAEEENAVAGEETATEEEPIVEETTVEETAEGVNAVTAEEKIRFHYQSDAVNVIVTLQNENDLPKEAELQVTPLEVTEDMKETIENTVEESGKTATSFTAFDISFAVDGVEVQPGDTVKVQISLPEVAAGDEAAVYHYNEETSEAENMGASVSTDGQLEFETPHFSTYVIVNQGEEEVTVTIQHFNYNNKNEKIYADDVRVLTPAAKIDNYKKALNWDVVEVTDEKGKVITDHENIVAKEDMAIKVYYEPSKSTVLGETTFYDYVVIPVEKGYGWGQSVEKPEKSINYDSNYSESDSAKKNRRLTVGTKDQNATANQYDAIVNGNQNANLYVKGEAGLVKNLVKGLNSKDWSQVEFNVDEPGVFSNEETVGKTIISDYKLQFERTGDTYELAKVQNEKGQVVEDNLNEFFPLDSAASNVTDNGYQGQHNYYFGMRYDVSFSIGDYVGPLNYSFTGDDDLWVILDGKTVVIDLGGIHQAMEGSVNLWEALGLQDENGNLKTLTEEQKNEQHRLTVLYMERGAGSSTCKMKFTLPSAQILNVTENNGETEGGKDETIDKNEQEIPNSTLEVDKKAKLLDWENREYQLTISGASLNTTTSTTEKNIDVMLVVDLSGSMNGNLNAGTSPQTVQVGRYKNVVNTLDTNNIYYYGTAERVTPTVSGVGYEYAQNPMKYIDGAWKYYSGGRWSSIAANSNKMVYSWDSRLSALKEAASSFTSGIAAKSPESKVGLASFYGASNGWEYYTTGKVNQELSQITANPAGMLYAINEMQADGGTSPQKALSLVKEQFEAANDENEKYVILISDGDPSEPNDKTETERVVAELKKEGCIIVTVGLGLNEDTTAWLQNTIASSSEYAYTATTVDGLKTIFNNLQNTLTQNTSILGAQITDVIDSRFELAEGEEERLTQKYGDKLTIVKNSDGTTTIIWKDQEILHSNDGGWKEELKIVAKDSFIGGNNITTNISPDSGITASGVEATFPQPAVNVKAEIAVNNNENTIFLGEAVSTEAEVLQALFDSGAVTGLNGEKWEAVDASKCILTWYEDTALTKEITLEEMGNVVPVSVSDEKKYYLHVAYQVDAPTEESNLSSTIDGTVYTAGDENNLVEAVNTSDHTLNYGIYTTKLVDGCITITKKISKDAYRESEGDPIFTFKITNLKNNKVYYRTVRFDISDKDTKVEASGIGSDYYLLSVKITKLPQGIYQIEELDSMGFVFGKITVDADATNCETKLDGERVLCAIGYDMTIAGNVFELEDYAGLVSGSSDDHIKKTMADVEFINKKSRESGKETDTDVVKNSLIIGEICKKDNDADNMTNGNGEGGVGNE